MAVRNNAAYGKPESIRFESAMFCQPFPTGDPMKARTHAAVQSAIRTYNACLAVETVAAGHANREVKQAIHAAVQTAFDGMAEVLPKGNYFVDVDGARFVVEYTDEGLGVCLESEVEEETEETEEA
jgi:hypothetical protein